jgi:hypothetical protein
MFNKLSFLALTISIFQLITFSKTAAAQEKKSEYRVINTIQLDGSTRWDLLTYDLLNHRLFITRGDSVDVLNTDNLKIIGSITGLHGAHNVALASELGKGFITNGSTNNLTVFSLDTLKTLSIISTGTKPDVVVYDPKTQRVFVMNADSADMTVIDASKGVVISTIKLGGKPEFALVDDLGQLYINLQDKAQIEKINTANLSNVSYYDLSPNCIEPTGLAIDIKENRLFSTCANEVMLVVDITTGRILKTLPIGYHSDAAAYDPKTKLAFSSNGDGTLTVVDASKFEDYRVIQNLITKPTARTMALDEANHKIYLVAAETQGIDPPNPQYPKPHPHIKPNTFTILVAGRK